MSGEQDGELVGEDMILGFEIWGLDAEDTGEGWLAGGGKGGELGVAAEEFGEAGGGEEMFGGDVNGWAR